MSLRTLSKLLKLSQKKVEAKRLVLLKLQATQQDYKNKIQDLESEKERERTHPSTVFFSSLEGYIKMTTDKIQALQKQIDALELAIVEAQKTLQEEYQEMKKVDLLTTHQLSLLREEQKKKEQGILDEVAQNIKKAYR